MSNRHSEGALTAPANAISGAWLLPYPLSLYPKFVSLNVNNYTPILTKTLEGSDLNKSQSRLLLTSDKVRSSCLLDLLTSDELESVHNGTGVNVRVWDESGIEYEMVFKFLNCNRAYRIIGRHWSQFLHRNAGILEVGDDIEICAFRIPKGSDSELGMVFLHRKKDRGLYWGRDAEDERVVKRSPAVKRGSAVNRSPAVERNPAIKRSRAVKKEEEMEVSQEEWIAAQALVQLQGM